MDDLKTVQALADEIARAAFDEGVAHGKGAKNFCGSNGKVFALIDALIAQMQRDAVQPAVPGTVDEILEWIVSMSDDEPIRNMARAARTKFAEAQALDSQLQQPDADSTRASGVCASTTQPARWYSAAEIEAFQQSAYAEGRRDEQDELASVLPGVTYMDPPDGGAPTILEQLQRQAKDAARYLWLRNHGLKYANVGLGTTCEGVDVVDFSPTFTIPEPAGMRYEDNEWSLDDLDAAIDAAMAPPADNKENGK